MPRAISTADCRLMCAGYRAIGSATGHEDEAGNGRCSTWSAIHGYNDEPDGLMMRLSSAGKYLMERIAPECFAAGFYPVKKRAIVATEHDGDARIQIPVLVLARVDGGERPID